MNQQATTEDQIPYFASGTREWEERTSLPKGMVYVCDDHMPHSPGLRYSVEVAHVRVVCRAHTLEDAVLIARVLKSQKETIDERLEGMDLVARGLRYDSAIALIKECAAQAGVPMPYEKWPALSQNLGLRIANAAHAAGFAEAVRKILGIRPKVISSLAEAAGAAQGAGVPGFEAVLDVKTSKPKSPERGTGRTTKLIQNAPQGAKFVVRAHTGISYAMRLAHSLGRHDLHVVSAKWLEIPGLRIPVELVVLDHDVLLNEDQSKWFVR